MQQQFPEWLRRPWPTGQVVAEVGQTVSALGLHTVCQSAKCPNLGECWSRGTATLMLLGDTCTRNCAFCSVASGRPSPLDPREPGHVAEAVARLRLRHVVITTVVRDDLGDGGATHIAETIRSIHRHNPGTTVEILVSDFSGNTGSIRTVLEAGPEVFSHNLETVRRLFPRIRDRRFSYESTLATLGEVRAIQPSAITKSALMVGHGESYEEVGEALLDLREAGCDAVCIGQYLRPSMQQREVTEFIRPEQFERYEELAYGLGFEFAVAGPFVRSSYRSEAVLDTEFAKRRLESMKGRHAGDRSAI